MATRGPTSLPLTPCSVEGCNTLANRRIKGIFYCDFHRERIYAFGEPEPAHLKEPKVKKFGVICKAPNCTIKPRPSQSYCSKHLYFLEKFSSLIPPEKLICSQCGKEQPYVEFTAKDHHVLHPQMKCHTCVAENRRIRERNIRKRRIERLKKDPVKWAEYRREQNKKRHERIKNNPVQLGQKRLQHRVYLNNRRARKKQNGGTHKKADILKLLDLQKNKCAACKKKLGKKYHVDHVNPIAKGGGSERENLQLLCPVCNRRKCAKDPIDFMKEIGYLI